MRVGFGRRRPWWRAEQQPLKSGDEPVLRQERARPSSVRRARRMRRPTSPPPGGPGPQALLQLLLLILVLCALLLSMSAIGQHSAGCFFHISEGTGQGNGNSASILSTG